MTSNLISTGSKCNVSNLTVLRISPEVHSTLLSKSSDGGAVHTTQLTVPECTSLGVVVVFILRNVTDGCAYQVCVVAPWGLCGRAAQRESRPANNVLDLVKEPDFHLVNMPVFKEELVFN